MNWKDWRRKTEDGAFLWINCGVTEQHYANGGWELTAESSEVRVDLLHAVNCIQVKVCQCMSQGYKGVAI
jgi:hypothetical protein